MARAKGIGEGRVVLSLTALEAIALQEALLMVPDWRLGGRDRATLNRARAALDEAVAEETRKAAERSAIMMAQSHDEGQA